MGNNITNFINNSKVNNRYFNILNNVYNELLEYDNLKYIENKDNYYFKDEDLITTNRHNNKHKHERKNIVISNKIIYGSLNWEYYGFQNNTEKLLNTVGLVRLVIDKKEEKKDFKDNFYELSYSVHKINKKYKTYLERECDLRYGFIVDTECDIRFYIYNNLYQEFKNCKPGIYYQFDIPIFHFFLNKKMYNDKNYYESLHIESNKNCEIKIIDLFIDSKIRKKFMNFIKNNNIQINEYIYNYMESEIINTSKQNDYYYYPKKYKDTSKLVKINFYNFKKIKNKLFKIYEKELMEKAWHPTRFQKWCLSIDEVDDLDLGF